MPPEPVAGAGLTGSGLAGSGLAGANGAAWRAGLVRTALVWAGLIALFWPEWRGMAYQWWHGASYAHVLLVPPILVWLVAMRVPVLAGVAPRCWWPGLGLLALAAAVWALGAFMGLAVASEAGAVAMLAAAVPLLLGARAAAGLAFPLCYMAFLVPAGDELIAPLQTLTARMTVTLLHASGVRAALDGVFISTPIGLFQIAEACSGLRFIIAMLAFGVLAANVCFIRARRRAVFVAVCAVLPVLANALRAWGTVALAQRWGLAWAQGFDHIVFGWVFFALVIAGTLAAFWWWFDRAADAPMIDGAALASSGLLHRWDALSIAPWAAMLAAASVVAGPALWVRAADGLHAPVPDRIALPQVPGWRLVKGANAAWQPLARGAARRVAGSYEDAAGHRVDVVIALYDGQGPGRKATTAGEGAVPALSAWAWQGPAPAGADAARDRMMNTQGVSRLAETSYRDGALLTGSRLALVLASAGDRLALRARPVALVILSAQQPADHGASGAAADAIDALRGAIGPMGRWIDGICRGPQPRAPGSRG